MTFKNNYLFDLPDDIITNIYRNSFDNVIKDIKNINKNIMVRFDLYKKILIKHLKRDRLFRNPIIYLLASFNPDTNLVLTRKSIYFCIYINGIPVHSRGFSNSNLGSSNLFGSLNDPLHIDNITYFKFSPNSTYNKLIGGDGIDNRITAARRATMCCGWTGWGFDNYYIDGKWKSRASLSYYKNACRMNGIKGFSRMNKLDMVKALMKA